MTHYRTCAGCIHAGPTCETRKAVKRQLAGLGVTSIAWRCKERESRFQPGDPVWCDTVCDYGAPIEEWEDEPKRDWYPGVVIRMLGSKAIVYIAKDAAGQYLGADHPFTPKGGGEHGFCKIPISRVRERDGTPDMPCDWCDLPASRGHMEGCQAEMVIRRLHPAAE